MKIEDGLNATLPEFLRPAPRAVRESFAKASKPFRLRKGTEWVVVGERCGAIAFPVSGSIRVYLTGPDGRDATLYRIGAGQACVLTAACILGRNVFPANAQVEEETRGLSVASETFRAWVEQVPFWREYVFGLLSDRLAAVLLQFEQACFERIEVRLARWLVAHAAPGTNTARATQQQIAADLGTAREVVGRALHRWRRAGLVATRRGEVLLRDRPRLEALAEST